MRLKSYYAGTVESAMRLARRELGEEAMLMNSRQAPPEARHLGEYEVVFAVDPAHPPAPDTASSRPATAGSDLAGEVAEIRKQLERMAVAVGRSNALHAGRYPLRPELAGIFSRLLSAEVDPELALAVTQSLEAQCGPDTLRQVTSLLDEIRREEGRAAPVRRRSEETPGGDLERALARELESRFEVSEELGRLGSGPQIVALVGPAGSGKTTTLVKLAVACGLSARRPVHLISMDTCRVAAPEQLRCYASILGVGFQSLDNVGALGQALEQLRNKEMVLIDTPGHSPKDLERWAELAKFLAAHSRVDTHLVLSSSTKPADLTGVVNRFAMFGPGKLLFTKLDETSSYGSLLNEAVRTRLPLSFLADGQQIPDDLEAASKARVIELLLKGRSSRTAIRVAAAA